MRRLSSQFFFGLVAKEALRPGAHRSPSMSKLWKTAQRAGISQVLKTIFMFMKKLWGSILLLTVLGAGCRFATNDASSNQIKVDEALSQVRATHIQNCASQALGHGSHNTLDLYHYNTALKKCFLLTMDAGLEGENITIESLPDAPDVPTDNGSAPMLVLLCFQSFPYEILAEHSANTCQDAGHSFSVGELSSHISKYMNDD
jgi:hypothetical protein